MLFLADATAPVVETAGGQQGGGMSSLLVLGLMMVGMWFLMIMPQRKRQKAHAKMIESIKKGDEVMTASGFYGSIVSVKDDRYVVSLGEGVKVEVSKAFIQQKI
ncbi:MAG: preprotein translocase subunit YajC [Verrucomicrobia bacterium GWF2_51_19]|nr:MAG: preprotein translocase subunit YajC [Verrucomicrobia bacterium GWF2_51_19]HCJ11681.1 preprotein translocase subunit YajC [Opitutae bacterium]